MINIIIFSKDRACQLELLLRSMKLFFMESSLCNVSILYKYSSDIFKKGYEKTKALYPEFKYILEENGGFKRQMLELINEKCWCTMFFVDDIVFKDYFFIRSPELKVFLNDKSIACLSLRMCHRINYCYTEKRETPPPIISDSNTWKWVGLPGDWGYPNSLDSNIFRTSEIMHLMRTMDYCNPNTLEGTWANHPPYDQPYMICFKESKIVNNPINKVQTANNNHCGNISAFEVNMAYLKGNCIRLEPFIGIRNISAHQELPITFTNSGTFTVSEFVSELYKNRIDYKRVLENSLHVSWGEDADINIFIPIRGRADFIPHCVKYLKRSAQEIYKIRIVIIENDEKPYNKNLVVDLGVDYIFIPNSISQSYGMFAKSLCYNVAYILTSKTKWNIFHDIDILVEPEYFKKLKGYLDKDPKWVQPYTKRRVLRISSVYTQKICNGDNLLLNSIPSDHVQESNPGSPGGSIVIRSDIFEEVGGYDPEIFFGYSPEDSFLWVKLEAASEEVGFMTNCFAHSGTFADDPAIEVYHMFHASMENENKQYKDMLKFKRSYFEFIHADKLEIVNEKKSILLDALNIRR
jgi:hypothetical protein